MKFEYNEAGDLVCALSRLATREDIRIRKKEMNVTGIPEIEEWVKKLESEIDPFLLSDIDLLVRKLPVTSWIMVKLIKRSPVCLSAEELIRRLNALPPEEFTALARESVSLPPNAAENREDILYFLTESTSRGVTDIDEETDLILSLLKNPAVFLERIKKLYTDFYEGYFINAIEHFHDASEEKFRWHKAAFAEDTNRYLEEVTYQNFSSVFEGYPEPYILYSYFYDFDIYISPGNGILIIGAGTDEFIKSKSFRGKADTLFSILGDKKRLEILRLISKRPWYSSELADYFKITPATMSYHLGKMAEAGFVKLKHGDQKRYYYSLNCESVKDYFDAASRDILGTEEDCE